MEVRENGKRYKDYIEWDVTKNTPYDYERNGLINRLMSKKIINTQNSITKFILKFVEDSFISCMKYIDYLKNFKNIHWKNR